MGMLHAQVWKSTPFTIERKEGKAPGTVIFCFCGPFTARDMFGTLAPIGLLNILSFQSTPSEELPALNILDLTDVPYMDSTGLGRIISHYVHCRGKRRPDDCRRSEPARPGIVQAHQSGRDHSHDSHSGRDRHRISLTPSGGCTSYWDTVAISHF